MTQKYKAHSYLTTQNLFSVFGQKRVGATLTVLCRLMLCVLFISSLYSPVQADDAADRRIRTGLKLFRALMAADQNITQKKIEGKLPVVILYASDLEEGISAATAFLKLGKGDAKGKIRGIPLDIKLQGEYSRIEAMATKPAAVFLAEPLPGEAMDELVKVCIKYRILLFSPFQGDVDRGAMGGLVIETRVRPYVNLDTLTAAGIQIKSFFLKVAKTHGK
ncbi:YfiR family protein [Oleiphilus messinensis]|nr:hypothetical protein [Oleiphilus messinensis]